MIINIKTNMIQIEKSFLGLQKNSGQGRYKAGISTICMPSINVFYCKPLSLASISW